MTVVDVATRFVEGLSGPDLDALEALVAPDARFWVNIGPAELSRDERFNVLRIERAHLRTLAFDDVRVHSTADGFVIQLTTSATTVDGIDLSIPVCLVVQVDEKGSIIRVDEYADSAPATPLLRAMMGGS